MMKVLIFGSLLVVAVSASLLQEHGAEFQAFKLKHGKTYKNQVEETKRFAIFKDNVRSIEEHNALYEQGLVTYKQGINQFTDRTREELKALLNRHPRPTFNTTKTFVKTGVAVPSSVDWRSEGYVTEVKDQGDCGSCWTFSVTGTVEGVYYRNTGQLVSMSEQQLLDCTTEFNYGCDGGWMDQTLGYVVQYGIQTDSSYPYTAVQGSCRYDQSQVVTWVSEVVEVPDESSLLEAVATIGPISVAMDATDLFAYESGVYSDPSCAIDDLNHGVLAVGYGSENGQDYWLIKNSWGSDWGDQGYFKLIRGRNECGIGETDCYPNIS